MEASAIMTAPPIRSSCDDRPPNDLLHEAVIRIRTAAGNTVRVSLPLLLTLLARDEIDDFPALRAHQRHPWHAFLVQVAAIALHRAARDVPWDNEAEWLKALAALTPGQPTAWHLIAPPQEPAILQAPDPDGDLSSWHVSHTPDAIDMLVTSRNHDLKRERIRDAEPDDWLFALVSLQTQEGFLGAGNYGISRMNGGFASRAGVGIRPPGRVGRHWRRDLGVILSARDRIATERGLASRDGVTLVWTLPWGGEGSLAFESLDPLYIEICRRIRLRRDGLVVTAAYTGSKSARIESRSRKGVTGDPWMPIRRAEATALTVSSQGLTYALMSELIFGKPSGEQPFDPGAALNWHPDDDDSGVAVLARVVVRGQGKTEGYHERHVPISKTIRQRLLARRTDELAACAADRVEAIGLVQRSLLRTALFVLFQGGPERPNFDAKTTAAQVDTVLRAFEAGEDARFFADLSAEFDAAERQLVRDAWVRALISRARARLVDAFDSGPQVGERRYRARAAALTRFDMTARRLLPQGARIPSTDPSQQGSADASA